MTDPKLKWHEVFNDGSTSMDAANCLGGVLLSIDDEDPKQYLPGYRVKEQQGDMDRAALVRR